MSITYGVSLFSKPLFSAREILPVAWSIVNAVVAGFTDLMAYFSSSFEPWIEGIADSCAYPSSTSA